MGPRVQSISLKATKRLELYLASRYFSIPLHPSLPLPSGVVSVCILCVSLRRHTILQTNAGASPCFPPAPSQMRHGSHGLLLVSLCIVMAAPSLSCLCFFLPVSSSHFYPYSQAKFRATWTCVFSVISARLSLHNKDFSMSCDTVHVLQVASSPGAGSGVPQMFSLS